MGAEQFWHGILPHHGVPGRRYREVAAFAAAFEPLMDRVKGTLSGAEVGILFSYEQNWALEIQPHHPRLDYLKVVQDLYQGFWDNQVPLRFVSPEASFDGLKLLVVPLLFLELPGLEERLRRFRENGGHLVLTVRTGVKDGHNRVLTDRALPGTLADLAGVEVEDYDCLRQDPVTIRHGSGTYHGELWWDDVVLKGAEAWAVADSSWHRGRPAITLHRGRGTWYLATVPDRDLLRVWAAEASREAGVRPLGTVPGGVELAVRRGETEEFLFVLNHGDKASPFRPEPGWTKVLGPEALEGYGFQVFSRTTRADTIGG
jgi:beta-galactosidase